MINLKFGNVCPVSGMDVGFGGFPQPHEPMEGDGSQFGVLGQMVGICKKCGAVYALPPEDDDGKD